jgi:hypothetical protein
MSDTSEWQYYVDGHSTSDHDLISRANELNRLHPLKLRFPPRIPRKVTPAEAARVLREHGHMVKYRPTYIASNKLRE